MRPTTTLLLLLLLAIFSPDAQACKTKNRFIEFGNGGGISGKYNEYKLDSKGVVYLKKDSSTYEKIKALTKEQTSAIFKDVLSLKKEDWNISEPGNMTYYIVFNDAKDKHTAKWGGTTTKPTETLKALYDKLILATTKDKP